MRGRGEALVYLYTAATAGVAGALHGMQKYPDLERTRRRINTSQRVVSSESSEPVEHTQLEETSHLEPRTRRSGSPVGVGDSDAVSGAECRHRAVGMV